MTEEQTKKKCFLAAIWKAITKTGCCCGSGAESDSPSQPEKETESCCQDKKDKEDGSCCSS